MPLTGQVPPSITVQPVSRVVDPTQTASFSVQAQGIGTKTSGIAYQWYKDGIPLSGASGPTLYVYNSGIPDEGNYYVVIGAFIGGTVQSSNATLTISRAPTASEKPPQIIGWSSPNGANANEGTTVTFKVATVGWNPLSFQWRLNGNVVPGATNEVYRIPGLSTNQSGI